jgi:hypothetical protein
MKQIYLLGAGFTRAVVGEKAPLTKDLMSKLDILRYPEIHEEYERAFPDIEQFLSILDLKILHFLQINNALSDHLNNIREDIVRQILNQVDIDSLHVDNLDSYPLLKYFLETIPTNSCILTLNFDCILDQGLYITGRWSPFGGYFYSTFPHTQNENDSKDRIILLKLHGSCNFRDIEAGQEYFNIEITDRIFPRIYANINSDPSDKPHILVMSYIKQFHNGIMSLWKEAISSLKEAERLIIVGCSLREEDTFLRFALYHFGMKKNTQKFVVDIIDKGKDNCKKIKEKVMKLVAYPDWQKVNLFDEGLEGYLRKT